MIGTAVQAGGRPRVIAHRGASAVAPPNSLAALEAAVAAGADAVEIDIGEGLLLGHDAADRRPGAPTLEAALELLAPTGLDVQVDLKHAAIEAAVAATLREHAFVGRSLVSSTSTAALRRLREADPDIPRARGYPHDRAGVSRVPWPAALIRASAGLARSATPLRLAGLAHGVQVVALHHARSRSAPSRPRTTGAWP